MQKYFAIRLKQRPSLPSGPEDISDQAVNLASLVLGRRRILKGLCTALQVSQLHNCSQTTIDVPTAAPSFLPLHCLFVSTKNNEY